MTTNLNEMSVPCSISAQKAHLVRCDIVIGMGDCEGGCQICRRGGRAYVVDGTVVKCGDGKKIYNKYLVVEQAII